MEDTNRGDKIMITEDTIIEAADHVTVADLGGEAVLLDSRSGEYFGVNEVGARILELAQQPAKVDAMLHDMFSTYDVDESRLKSDTFAFLAQMAERRLIKVSGK